MSKPKTKKGERKSVKAKLIALAVDYKSAWIDLITEEEKVTYRHEAVVEQIGKRSRHTVELEGEGMPWRADGDVFNVNGNIGSQTAPHRKWKRSAPAWAETSEPPAAMPGSFLSKEAAKTLVAKIEEVAEANLEPPLAHLESRTRRTQKLAARIGVEKAQSLGLVIKPRHLLRIKALQAKSRGIEVVHVKKGEEVPFEQLSFDDAGERLLDTILLPKILRVEAIENSPEYKGVRRGGDEEHNQWIDADGNPIPRPNGSMCNEEIKALEAAAWQARQEAKAKKAEEKAAAKAERQKRQNVDISDPAWGRA